MMEIRKTGFGELRVWAPYNRDFDKKIKAAGGQMQAMPGKNQSWVIPEEIKMNTIRQYMYESYGRSDLDDEREEILSRLADIEDQINKIKGGIIMEKKDVFGNPVILEEEKGGNIMEKRDIYGGPIIQDPKEREKKVGNSLPIIFEELFAMGWRDNDARIYEKETFFEMLKGYAEGIPEEEIWEAWGYYLKYTEEELMEHCSEEKVAAIMSGDDEALAEIIAEEHEKEFEAIMKDLEGDIDLG